MCMCYAIPELILTLANDFYRDLERFAAISRAFGFFKFKLTGVSPETAILPHESMSTALA